MTDQAHRVHPCRCATCRADRVVRDIAWGILFGLAAVGVVVGVWALLVIVLTGGPR